MEPNSQLLLVVLLDQSGSLIFGNKPTDPNGYSTSVTNALADLWPGNAGIPFTGDATSYMFWDRIRSPTGCSRRISKKVQAYLIGGDTLLEPVVQEALDLVHQKNNPAGSRMILITDGNPTGIGANLVTGFR